MGLREIKSELGTMEKSEVLKIISEMYKNVPMHRIFRYSV